MPVGILATFLQGLDRAKPRRYETAMLLEQRFIRIFESIGSNAQTTIVLCGPMMSRSPWGEAQQIVVSLPLQIITMDAGAR
jgi:hypothetical protein